MDTKEGIEKFWIARRELGRSIASQCNICEDVAWTTYYGSYACRECCAFFVVAIYERKEYWCKTNGFNCHCKRKWIPDCSFCWLRLCFYSGLKPHRVGINQSGKCFLEETKNRRKRVPNRIPVHADDLLLVEALSEHFEWCYEKYEKVMDCRETPPPPLTEKQMRRQMMWSTVVKSMNLHGNLMLKRCFLDPYKCKLLSVQNLTIELLEMVEMMENFEHMGLYVGEELRKKLIYFEELDTDDEKIRRLQEKILSIDKCMDVFEWERVYYTQELKQQ